MPAVQPPTIKTGSEQFQNLSIAQTLKAAGWPTALIPEAYAIVIAESGGNASAVNPSSGATGWFQILPSNFASLGLTASSAKNPAANSAAAYKLYKQIGFKRGWTTYGGKSYTAALKDYNGSTLSKTLSSPVVNAVTGGASSAISSVGDFIGAISNPEFWRRIGIGVGGVILMIVGLALMLGTDAKSLAQSVPNIVPV